jgi:hypothetical protein
MHLALTFLFLDLFTYIFETLPLFCDCLNYLDRIPSNNSNLPEEGGGYRKNYSVERRNS